MHVAWNSTLVINTLTSLGAMFVLLRRGRLGAMASRVLRFQEEQCSPFAHTSAGMHVTPARVRLCICVCVCVRPMPIYN